MWNELVYRVGNRTTRPPPAPQKKIPLWLKWLRRNETHEVCLVFRLRHIRLVLLSSIVWDGKSSSSFSQPVTYGWLRELQNSKRIVTPDNLQSDAFQAGWLIILAARCTSRRCMWPIRYANGLCQIIYSSLCLLFTVDQETMCAGFNSSLASQNMTLLDCNVECCSGNNCNIQNLTSREYTPDTLVDVSGTSD